MSNSRSLFEELDVSHKSEVRLGDDKKVQVEGKGTIAISTSNGKKKLLQDVFFVPNLAHNLLSVGQLVKNGYVVVFDDGHCVIKDKKSGQNIASVSMTRNKMFPLDMSSVDNRALVCKGCTESDLWHLRYGHLHLNGLKLLHKKDMVLGLPTIESIEFCEGCVMDLGLLHYFLGLEVKQGADGIFISQRKFAMDLVKRFNLTECKSACTPMNVNEKLSTNDGSGAANAKCYRSMVGGLNYLSHTRPDIAHSVGVVSRFMHNPTKHHLGAVKRILQYVAGTPDFGIWYSKVQGMRLVGYCDSDWAG
ncbi:hypothetical protein BVRB_6g146570 [Beta vulgaris subsp. vulgaris]|nr:hypothetical protein BVRB_6g146570 [Beta vulgaris subsp. vulgaris]